MKTIYLDFDEKYKDISPEDNDFIVLSNSYENEWCVDVRKFRDTLFENVKEFENEWNILLNTASSKLNLSLKAVGASFFRNTLSVFSRWIEAIDYYIKEYDIEKIIFSSYIKNPYVFVYEAEGEVNRQFLYKKNHYLPYYIHNYLTNKYKKCEIIFCRKKNKFIVVFNFFARNIFLFGFIILKSMIYRFFVFKRNFSVKFSKEIKYIISSRAMVQTEFIQGFLKKNKTKSILFINEQSNNFFRNYKFVKKLDNEFLYVEGYIRFKDFLKIIKDFFLKLIIGFRKNNLKFNYLGVDFKLKNFILDIIVREIDFEFYSFSIKNMTNQILKDSGLKPELLCFEMFTPYSFYLKNNLCLKVYQIQTTLIESLPIPNFVGGSKFFFTNPITFKNFIKLNQNLENKLDCIPFMKYIGISKKSILSKPKRIVYFSQPIDFEEEIDIIDLLITYTQKNDIDFFIKLHPRQNNLRSLYNKDIFIDQTKTIGDIMNITDIAITRFSSVGLDFWIYGVPCIFVKLNTPLQKLNLFFAPSDYYGTVTSLDQLQNVIQNYNILYQEFNNHPLNEIISVSDEFI